MSVTAISLEDSSINNYDKMSKQFEHTVTNMNTSVVVGGGSSSSSSSSSSFSSKIVLLSGPASPMPSNDEAIRASTIITTTTANTLNTHHSDYPSPQHHHYHHHQYHSPQQQQQMAKRPKTPPSTSHQQLENTSKQASSKLLTSTIGGAATALIKITPSTSQSKLTTAMTTTSANIFQQRDISDATKTTASTVVDDEAHQRELLEEEIGQLKAERNFLQQQFTDAQRREKILMRRLANKEQEFQDYVTQIAAYKAAQAPAAAALRSALLDPAVNILFEKLKKELKATKARLEETQNELAAWKFTPDSNTGKRLMAKCRLLYQENEELGKMTSNGRLAKLETELAMQKSFSEEVKKSQSELEDFLQELDEDVEGMQSTILFLQQELKTTQARIEVLEKENYQLRAGCNINVHQGHQDEQQQQQQLQQQQGRKNKPFKMENTEEEEEKVSSLEGSDNDNNNIQVVHESSPYNGPTNITIKSSPPPMHVGNSGLQNAASAVGSDKLLIRECKADDNTFVCPLNKKNINNSNNSNTIYNITEDSMQEKILLTPTTTSSSLEVAASLPVLTATPVSTASSTTIITNACDVMQKDVNMSEMVVGGKLRTVASRKRNYDGITTYENVLSGGGFGGNVGVGGGGVSGAGSSSGAGPNMTPSPRILPPKKSKLRVPPTSRTAMPSINEYDVLTVTQTATPITSGAQAGTNIITAADTIISNYVNHHANHEIEIGTTHETFDGEIMNTHLHQQQTNDGITTQRIITRRRSVRLNGIAPNGPDAI